MRTFEVIRARASAFCSERDWHKYHTPVNLAIALAGECGEVCEIFQWKGELGKDDISSDMFSEDELINIGEEMADVFIYTTRLSDMCSIDLARSVIYCSKKSTGLIDCRKTKQTWDDVEILFLREAEKSLDLTADFRNNPRHLVLDLQRTVGQLSSLFLAKSEKDSEVGLPNWSSRDINELSLCLGTICIIISALSRLSKHSLFDVISDKFGKNERKYPADVVRGSSAKYTYYEQKKRLAAEAKAKEAATASGTEKKDDFVGGEDVYAPRSHSEVWTIVAAAAGMSFIVGFACCSLSHGGALL